MMSSSVVRIHLVINAIVASYMSPHTNTYTMIVQISRSLPQLLLNMKQGWTTNASVKTIPAPYGSTNLWEPLDSQLHVITLVIVGQITHSISSPPLLANNSTAQTSMTNLIFYHHRLRQSCNNISIQMTKYYDYFFSHDTGLVNLILPTRQSVGLAWRSWSRVYLS